MLLIGIIIFFANYSFSQEYTINDLELDNPSSIVDQYTYDPISDRYFYNQTVGEYKINLPIILTTEEFEKLILEEDLKNYYKEKISP